MKVREVKSCAWYIDEARRVQKIPSDRQLGKLIGQQSSSVMRRARLGYLTDPMAIAIAELANIDPGELLFVARAEREKDKVTRAHLMAYAKKAVASVSSIGVAIFAALTLGGMPAREVRAAGGDGR